MSSLPYVHVLTPGDHFSPRTGSALPTVVSGLSQFDRKSGSRSSVLVGRDTYPDRYPTAGVIEYETVETNALGERYVDPVLGRIGAPRIGSRRAWNAALESQSNWTRSVIFAHNGPQLLPSVDKRHMAILYAHNELFRTYSKREVGRTLSAMDGLICVSDFLADRLSLRMPASLTDRLRVVVNGVDVNAFHPRTPAARDAQLHVMFVGRVIPEKGPDVLIDALARMQRTDIRLTLVGSKGFSPSAPLSAYERKLRQMAAPLGDRVHFVASIVRQRLPELIRNADVLVVPSRWPEPSGLTVLEGMASGIPVIASSIGGIPQLMGSAGIAVRPDSPEELAEAIRALADDESLRRRVANECRFHAEGRDWSRARAELDGCVYAMA